jgi:PAS domain S-box-containing protein
MTTVTTTVKLWWEDNSRNKGFTVKEIAGKDDIPEDAAVRDANRTPRHSEVVCNNVTVGLFAFNDRQECTYLNPAAERLTGYSAAELNGRTLHDVVHHTRPDGSPYAIDDCPIGRALRQGIPAEGEETFIHKDGRLYPVAYTLSPIFEADGSLATVVEIRDISREKLRSIDDSDAVETINRIGRSIAAELDLQKLVQLATNATTQLCGAQFGAFFYNVINQNGEAYMLYTLSGAPAEAFAQFPMPRNTEVFAATFSGSGAVRSDDIRHDPRYGKNSPYHGMPSGHLPVISYLAVPIISRSGEVLGGLFFGHEQAAMFSERDERIVVGIAAQAAVAIDNARLYEAEQAARAEKEALLAHEQAIRSELERANRMKDEFLATLSHELRTPLNAVLGYATLLQSDGLTEDERHEGFQAIERSARQQAQLIEDLLDMNRIISGKIRLDVQLVDLPQIIDAALDTIFPSAEAKGIRVQKLIDPLAGPIKGDPGRIQQVVWNLLSNAVKFTPRGGKIQVLLERVNSHVEITVVDSGQGIAPEFLPFVFDRFRQADASTTRRYGGLGLGLSIVKQLVELHGGTVRAKSPGDGKGSTFVVGLPVAVVHPDDRLDDISRAHPKASQGESIPCDVLLKGVRVLVVDDEPDSCRLVQRILEDCEAEVSAAHSAKEGFQVFQRKQPFDVIISDIGMPEEDGYDLIRKIRALAEDKGGETPALALTAFARSEDRTRAALAGFQTHLSKPVEVNELIAVVANLAGRTTRLSNPPSSAT